MRLLGLFGAMGGATWSYEALGTGGVGPVCLLTMLEEDNWGYLRSHIKYSYGISIANEEKAKCTP